MQQSCLRIPVGRLHPREACLPTLCQKLAREQLYSSASVIATPRTAVVDGSYVELSPMTGLRSFVAYLAGHIAAEAAR